MTFVKSSEGDLDLVSEVTLNFTLYRVYADDTKLYIRLSVAVGPLEN